MKHYFPKNSLAAKDFRRKKQLMKEKAKKKNRCLAVLPWYGKDKTDKEDLEFLRKEAYMDSKEFHRMFSYSQFFRMAEDLDRLRRLP